MGIVNGVPKEKAPADVALIYDNLAKMFGKVPNIFAVMAHRPGALAHLLPLYGTIMDEGTVDARYKELAYLKTSIVNGCEY